VFNFRLVLTMVLGLAVAQVSLLRANGGNGRATAIALYEDRRYGPAREAFQQLEADRLPIDEELDFFLGRLALWFDDRDEAVARLERAVRDTPRSARLHNALGDAYGLAAQQAPLLAKLGWARRCVASYRKAVELEPENPLFRWSLFGYYLVAPGIAGGGRDKALAEARRLQACDDMAGRIALATLHLADQRAGEAFAQFDELCDERADDFLVLYHVGRCAALSGEQIDRGIAALRRCLELEPPRGEGMPTIPLVHYRLAALHEARGEKTEAAGLRARAWKLNPDLRPEKSALKN
jgi:tetratricopeptide (TPR) repeat protein